MDEEFDDDEDDDESDSLSISEYQQQQKKLKLSIREDISDILDSEFNPTTDATLIYNWLYFNSSNSNANTDISTYNVEQFQLHLAELLTARTALYRKMICVEYEKMYTLKMVDDIRRKLKSKKGLSLTIIKGLLMNSEEFDAELIGKAMPKWDIAAVSQIIGCKSIRQLKQIQYEYKNRFKTHLWLFEIYF